MQFAQLQSGSFQDTSYNLMDICIHTCVYTFLYIHGIHTCRLCMPRLRQSRIVHKVSHYWFSHLEFSWLLPYRCLSAVYVCLYTTENRTKEIDIEIEGKNRIQGRKREKSLFCHSTSTSILRLRASRPLGMRLPYRHTAVSLEELARIKDYREDELSEQTTTTVDKQECQQLYMRRLVVLE